MNKKKNLILNILKVAAVVGIITAVVLNYDRLTNLDIRAMIASIGSFPAAVALILGIYALKSVTFVVPAMLVYLSVGMAFKPLTAVLIDFVGIAIEVTITYFLGRFLGKDAVYNFLKDKKGGSKLLNMKAKSKAATVFVARFTAIPIDFSSLFFGAFGYKYPSYLILSVIGIMPRVIMNTFIGSGVYEYVPMKWIIIAVICGLSAFVVVFTVKKIIEHIKSKKSEGAKA